GETEQRLYGLSAWRETPFYTDRERAALAWTEAVTLVSGGPVPDALYQEARRHFSEKELVDLTLALIAINAWNRLSISFRTVPGTYRSAAPRQEVPTALCRFRRSPGAAGGRSRCLRTTVRTSIATSARLTLREDLHPPCSLPIGSARSTPPTCQGTARHCPARKRFSTGSCSSTSSVPNAACLSGRGS